MIQDYFAFVIRSMRQRKLRSWLTITGIVIGVAAVIALISIGNALESSVVEQFDMFGTNLIMVTPSIGMGVGSGFATTQKLTDRDVGVMERVSGIETVLPMWYQFAEAEFKGEKKFIQVIGVPPREVTTWLDNMGVGFEKGRFIRDSDKYSVNVGNLVAKDFFERDVDVGDKIIIRNERFRIVGIVEAVGNRQDDTAFWIPLDTAKALFESDDGDYGVIMAITRKGTNIDRVAADIEHQLERSRGQKDFSVMTPEKILEQINTILSTIKAVLVGIASISILVGGVGIMNTMYMAVIERTKEIGIMKAIGARNRDIMSIFLLEAGVIGFIGGIFGLILGYALAYGFAAFGLSFFVTELPIQLDPLLIIFGLSFAMFLGIISGLLPARKASKLSPIEALRHE